MIDKTKEFDNDDVINSFTPEQKEELFNDLVSLYFRKNFGSLSKVDLETLLFSYYYEQVLKYDTRSDDYTIGKDLGLTISRVRSLKERKELKYPRQGYEWKDLFFEYAQYAKFDDVHHLIKFSIPDVNVIKDVRHYLEQMNAYDEVQLNPKLFSCRPDTFIEVCKQIALETNETFTMAVLDDKALKSYLENSKNPEKEKGGIQKILQGSVEEGIKELLINASKETLLTVISFINPGAGAVAKMMFDILKGALER